MTNKEKEKLSWGFAFFGQFLAFLTSIIFGDNETAAFCGIATGYAISIIALMGLILFGKRPE